VGVRRIRVLLVDDERLYVESLAKVLQRRGFEVVIAYDGAASVALAAEQEPDVVVLDLRMPRHDGLATLDDLRNLNPCTPVILLTGHADLECASAALQRGAADVLLKPCPVDVLIPAIENAAERRELAIGLAPAR
jgi:two-component system, OmpR family, response regulator